MANDKKFVVKNGLQANNVAFVNESNASNIIEASMLSTDTLSFSGNAGQLFSISDTMSGVIFGVNDVSGVPSIEVDDTGDIRLAELGGNVSIGTTLDTHKLYVQGNSFVNGAFTVNGNFTVTDVTVSGNLTVSGTTTYINTTSLNVGDNIITLNADLPGATAPTENAGIEINRGSSANVQFVWDETNDRWSTNGQPLALSSLLATSSINAASFTVGSNFIANTTGAYHTGVINSASFTVGSNFIANTTGAYHTGSMNAATLSVGSSFVANTTGAYHSALVNSASFTVGSNFVANTTRVTLAVPTLINNQQQLRFQTVNTSAYAYMVQQNDDNFVFYTSNTTYGQRAVWSIFANSITSSLNIDVALRPTAGLIANNTIGSSGQVLKTNGSTLYWDTAGGTGTVTQVVAANGLSGGTITATGQIDVVGGSGLVSNSSGVHVGQGNGINVSTDAINVTGGSTLTVNTAGVHVNSALSITSLTLAGAASGITTLGAGNTTITGFANVVSGNIQLSSGFDIVSPDNFAIYDSTNTRDRFAFSTSNFYDTRSGGRHIFSIAGANVANVSANGVIIGPTVGSLASTDDAFEISPPSLASSHETRNYIRLNDIYNAGVNGQAFYIKSITNGVHYGGWMLNSTWGAPILLGAAATDTSEANNIPTTFVRINQSSLSTTGLTFSTGNTTITGFANVSVSVNSAAFTVGTVTVANTTGITTTVGANAINLTNTTSNWIYWNPSGVAAPAVGTRSAGTKLVIWPEITASTVDYGIGIEGSHLWFSAANLTAGFKWYSNTTNIMTANTTGLLLAGTLSGVTTAAMGNTTITGFANVSVSVNSALYTVGSTVVANATGVYATQLNGQLASFYTNATNITTGTLPYAQIPANIVNTTASFTLAGITTFSSNVVLGSSGLSANGGFGTAGQVLHSNGTATYWSTDDGITSLVAANGLSGGTITATGQIDVVGGSGLVSNSSGVHVGQGNGISVSADAIAVTGGSTLTVNATGVHVNSALSLTDLTLSGNLTVSGTTTYINTTSLNVGDNIITLNADLPGATAPTENAGIEVNRGSSANVQFIWDETNDRWSTNGQPLALSSLIATGAASGITTLAAGNTTITGFANVSVGVNSALYTVGSTVVANSTGVYATQLNGQLASFYTNATNITTGTLPYAQIPANIVNTTAAFTYAGIQTYNANVVIGATGEIVINSAAGISANGTFGTAGQMLTTNGTAAYWSTPITGVTAGTGLTGGGTSGSLTVSVGAGTGIVVNTDDIAVNASYIATISANNASFLQTRTWEAPGTIGSTTANTGAFTSMTVNSGAVYRSDWIAGFQSTSDFTLGTLVTTDIPANVTNGDSFLIEITGKSYSGSNPPFKVIAQGYLYTDTIIAFSGISYGGVFASYIKIFEEGGVLKFWWPTISYWNSFNVLARTWNDATNGTITRNRVTSITNIAEPTGTKKVQVNLATYMRADITATNAAEVRATLFRDSVDTAYYLDPGNTGTSMVVAGNVSIGTTSSSARLHVSGSTRIEHAGDRVIDFVRSGANSYSIEHDTSRMYFYNLSTANAILSFTNGSNVGVGVADPTNKFQVNYGNPVSVPSAGAAGHCTAFGTVGYGLATGALTNGNAYLQATRWDGTATNYNLLLQPNGGNVGIGTGANAPNGTLTVFNSATFNARTSGINVHRPSSYGQYGSFAYDSDAIYLSSTYTGGGAGVYGRFIFDAYDSTSTPVTRMLIDASGNIGVGTTSPSSYGKLAVVGGNIGVSQDGATVLTLRSNAGATNIGAYNATGSTLAFQTNSSGAGETEKMRITTDGNVGIGTTTPRGTLSLGTSLATATTQTLHFGYTPADFYGYRLNSTNTPSSTAAGTFAIQRGNTTAWTTELLINDTGNVGIGTTSPALKFVVSNRGAAGLEIDPTAVSSAPVIQSYNRSGAAYTQLTFDALEFVWRPSGTERMRLNQSGNISFGSQTRQMINLWSDTYGIGVQNSTTYFRSAARFSWHRGGAHTDTENDAGAGGTVAMTLDSSSNLIVTGEVRGTLFRDTVSSGYYLDPNSTSVLNIVRADQIQFSSGNAATVLNNASYHIHYDPAGRPAIYMGGADPGNYYDNTTHYFRNRTPANQFLIYGNTARRGEYDSSNGRLLIYADSGGWAMGTYFIGSTGTNRGGFGALGSGNDLSTFWIGTEYNSPAVNIFADGRVVAIGSHRAPIFYPDTGTSFYLDLDSTGTSLNVAGAIVAAGNITAYSDIRVKNNITVISDAINKLDKISGITYTRTDLKDKERRYAGVIAQEIEEVLPEAVFGDDNTKTVDYNATIALLIQAVKEQQVLINKLEEKVNILENK